MLTLESLWPDKFISVFLAIGFAEKALPIWEQKYPEDMRPREAIEAAKEWLKNPSYAAANDAHAAANAARTAVRAAAYAAYAAAYAANAANAAANAAAYAAASGSAAANAAAVRAALALVVDEESLIHEVMLLSLIHL